MPGSDELEWRSFEDFTGGLWEQDDDRRCATNGLLECTDCFPSPDGGLKAFAEFQPVRAPFVAGDAPTTPTWALGIWAGADPATTRGLFVMLMSGLTSPYTLRLVCLATAATISQSDLEGGGASWDATLTRADVTAISPAVHMESFQSASATNNYFNLPISISVGSTNGIWTTDQTTAAFSFNPGASTLLEPVGVTVYQNRLLTIGPGLGAALHRAIWYTDPGAATIASTNNYIQPGAAGGLVQFIQPHSPSDLIFVTRGNYIGSAQGAITSPTVREYNRTGTNIRTFPADTPLGLVMVVANEGAYAWDGQSFTHISQAILGDPMGGPSFAYTQDTLGGPDTGDSCNLPGAPWAQAAGTVASGRVGSYEHWVLFSNGYVLDLRTGAWFKQTSAPGARYWAQDYSATRVYVTTNDRFQVDAGTLRPTPHFAYWSNMGENQWTPSATYSFTVPLIDSPSQRTNLREVEYDITTYNGDSTLTVEVTSADGTDDVTLGPYTLADSRPDGVRVLVPGHPQEWYKVRTILKSNRPGTSAPTMRRMRVGTQPSTRNPVNR